MILWEGLLTGSACAQDVEQEPPKKEPTRKAPVERPLADPNKHAIIISGLSGEEPYAKQFTKWTDDLHSALIERLAFADDHVQILTEKPAGTAMRATADGVKKAFATLRTAVKPEHTVFIFF